MLDGSKSITLVTDNLNIGGVQRLVLDQAYYFSELGFACEIISLNEIRINSSILEVDKDFFASSKITIHEVTKSNWEKLKFFISMLKEKKSALVLSHSGRGLLYLAITRRVLGLNFKLIGFMHQLPLMSSKTQNIKRAIYFTFADEVHAVSNQFKLEYDELRAKSLFYKIIFRSDIVFNRIGLYLPRLINSNLKSRLFEKERPLIFLGRLTKWKGFDLFCRLVTEKFNEFPVIIFTSPDYFDEKNHLEFLSSSRRIVCLARSISSFSWESGAIHIYPTIYPSNPTYPMSISLNVLESCVLAIPSLISIEGFETWPELKNSNLIALTDWSSKGTFEAIYKMLSIPQGDYESERDKILHILDIQSHCMKILKSVGDEEKLNEFG